MTRLLQGAGVDGFGPAAFSPASLTGINAWWDFADNTSYTITDGHVTTLQDKVGNNDMVNATALEAPIIAAGGFNGRDCGDFRLNGGFVKHLAAATYAFATSGATFSMAARVKGAAQQNKMILGFGDGSLIPVFYVASGNTTQSALRFLVTDNSTGGGVVEAGTAFDSEWHSIMVTYGVTEMKLYVDGVLVSNTGFLAMAAGDSNGVLLGARNAAVPENHFEGFIEYGMTGSAAWTLEDAENLHAYGA